MSHRREPTAAQSRRPLPVLLALSLLAGVMSLVPATPAAALDPDLAQFGQATASAEQSDRDGTFPASNAIDGDPATRWASGNGPDDADAEFTADLTVDLGRLATVSGVTLEWEASYAVAYDVQVAAAAPEAAASWTTVHAVTAGDGGADAITIDPSVRARYVRVTMHERAAATWEAPILHYYGYSLYTVAVHGTFDTPVAAIGPDATISAGDSIDIPVRLSNASATEQSVRVRSDGGSAGAGVDYTAIDEVVVFAPGETTGTVTLDTVVRGALVPAQNVVVTVSEPTAGVELAERVSATITILPTSDAPEVGAVEVLHDFEAGVPTDLFVWASTDPVRPALTTVGDDTVPGSAVDNDVLVATVTGPVPSGSWFGFSHDTPAADWSDFDGVQFWFLGTGSGDTLSYEVKSDGNLFDADFVDDAAGWQRVSVLFSDLRLKGNHSSDIRFNPNAATGFAVTLTGMGEGEFRFDDFALFERALLLDDFETPVPIGSDENPVGYITWRGGETTITIGQEARERPGVTDNHVLAGTYHVAADGWGGISKNLEYPQDWSSFHGIRFWWYASQDSNPASPTAGADIRVEVKDRGPDAEHSELWVASFKDNWGSSTSRWKLVELPFSDFTLRTDHQAGAGETLNGTLDLDRAWGFAITFPPGTATPVGWAIDHVELYGTPSIEAAITVEATPEVVLVDGGETAEMGIRILTTDGEPLVDDVVVDWRTGTGTAVEGTDYAPASGSLTFEAGTPSGTVQTITVQTAARAEASEALAIPVELQSTLAGVPERAARIVLNAHGMAYLDPALSTDERVDDLLGRMTLAEKAGQMAQAERLALSSPEEIAELALGSVLSGGGSTPSNNTPLGWAEMIDGYQRQALSTRLQIPLIYGADAVHGHSNLVGATIFPHNVGLGATRDLDLVREIGRVTASEARATGLMWTFGPAVSVGRDERWGRFYEAYSEDPALVTAFAGPATLGLQGDDPTDITAADEVLATAKHWAGDGGTTYDPSLVGRGYPIDQGITELASVEEFMQLHAAPYLPAIAAGLGSIMPSYSGVSFDGGPVVRMTENRELNIDLLKGELGFDGFLVGDWEAIDKLPGGTYAEKVERSINGGLDMGMTPYNYTAFINAVVAGVESDRIAQERVDDAVRRILTAKMHLGLFEQPYSDDSQRDLLGGEQHRGVAREAAAKSQVLLRNDGALPLASTGRLYVAGSNADDLGHQMGGWTISWQGGSGDTTEGTTILEGLRDGAPELDITYSRTADAPTDGYDAGLVVVGERPYAEGVGDVGNNGFSMHLSAADQQAIETVCAAMECTVLVVSGRPQILTGAAAEADAVVASWLPGSEGSGVADVLLGRRPFTGALPATWPASADQLPINVGDAQYDPAYPYGWGLRTDPPRDRIETLAGGLEGEARAAAQALLDADVWGEDGSLSDPALAWALLEDVAATVTGTGTADLTAASAIVSVARDVAQAAVLAGTAEEADARISGAEHALWSGDPVLALELLAAAAGIEPVSPPPATPPPTTPPTTTAPPSAPPLQAPYEVPGFHDLNGRLWYTTCEEYSQTTRCRTDIWATTVIEVGGRFVAVNGWAFNNLTYLPYMKRHTWGDNPLANDGGWTATDGRRWRTECDTAATGGNGCRSYAWVNYIEGSRGADGVWTYRWTEGWRFNNIVNFHA